VLKDSLFVVGNPAVAQEGKAVSAELVSAKPRRNLAGLEGLLRSPTEVATWVAVGAWGDMMIPLAVLTGLSCPAFAPVTAGPGSRFNAITYFANCVHSGISTVLCTVPELQVSGG